MDTVVELGSQPILIEKVRHREERVAFKFLAGIAGLVWILLAVFAPPFFAVALGFVFFTYTSSLWAVSYIRGNGVRVGEEQYPEIHRLNVEYSARLGLKDPPEVYIVEFTALNAFTAIIVGRKVVVLFSYIVESLLDGGDIRQVGMVLGHELGHIAAGHIRWDPFIRFRFGIPFLYPLWSRRAEYTCDRVGLLCAGDLDAARQALAKLMVGREMASRINFPALERQRRDVSRSLFVRLSQFFATHPHLINRLYALEEFAALEAGLQARVEESMVLATQELSPRPVASA